MNDTKLKQSNKAAYENAERLYNAWNHMPLDIRHKKGSFEYKQIMESLEAWERVRQAALQGTGGELDCDKPPLPIEWQDSFNSWAMREGYDINLVGYDRHMDAKTGWKGCLLSQRELDVEIGARALLADTTNRDFFLTDAEERDYRASAKACLQSYGFKVKG